MKCDQAHALIDFVRLLQSAHIILELREQQRRFHVHLWWIEKLWSLWREAGHPATYKSGYGHDLGSSKKQLQLAAVRAGLEHASSGSQARRSHHSVTP